MSPWAALLVLSVPLAVRGAAPAEAADAETLRLPEISLQDLEEGAPAAIAAARRALSGIGALAATGVRGAVGKPLGEASREALEAWASCLRPGGSARDAALVRPLAGGLVRRASVTTGGAWAEGESPLDSLPLTCEGARSSTEVMRLAIRRVAKAAAAAVDAGHVATRSLRPAAAEAPVVLALPDGSRVGATLSEAVAAASHLEHLHLYEEVRNGSPLDNTLDLHTDAGLMLAFVPPLTADASREDGWVRLQTPDGVVRSVASPPADSVVLLVGEAARMLHSGGRKHGLRPAPHALRLSAGFSWRAWFGAMLLLPENAVVRPDLTDDRVGVPSATFGAIWEAAQASVSDNSSKGEGLAIACGRRMSVADPAGGCEAGKLACWMLCMDVRPPLDSCSGGAWQTSGPGDIAEWVEASVQCRNPESGAEYQQGTHCNNCELECVLSGSSSSTVSGGGGGKSSDVDGAFCRQPAAGMGTTMYMEGFMWTSASPRAVCLVFLFPSWVIDQPWKLFLACLGVVAISSTVELTSLAKRSLPAKRQNDVGLLCHAGGLILAYIAMLFIMTYSYEVCASVIVGLVLGHVMTKRISRGRLGAGAGAGTPCCQLASGSDISSPETEKGNAVWSETNLMVSIAVEGMTCDPCTCAVESALRAVSGVGAVIVSLKDRCAIVSCNAKVTERSLTSAVEGVGFKARLQERPPSPSTAETSAAAAGTPS